MIVLKVTWVLSMCAYAVLLARIFQLGKVRTYPYISTYLALDIAANLLLAWFPSMGKAWFDTHRDAYYFTWVIVNPILLASLTLAVWATFRRMCAHFYNFTWAIPTTCFVFGLIATAAALAPLPIEWLSVDWNAPYVQLSIMVVRYCHTVLVVFMVCTYVFFMALKRSQAPALVYRPNVIVCLRALIGYVGAQIIGEVLSILHKPYIDAYSALQLTLLSAALLWWAASLSESGDQWTPAPVPINGDGARFARLRRLVMKQERRRSAAAAGD